MRRADQLQLGFEKHEAQRERHRIQERDRYRAKNPARQVHPMHCCTKCDQPGHNARTCRNCARCGAPGEWETSYGRLCQGCLEGVK